MVGWVGGGVGGWSDTDNKANLSPASLHYAANGAVAELGKILKIIVAVFLSFCFPGQYIPTYSPSLRGGNRKKYFAIKGRGKTI